MTAVARTARRSQAGFTLVEMLLVIAISGIIAIPVLAWMVTAFKTEAVVQRSSKATNASNQLSQFFPRDMSSAYDGPSGVTIGGSNCAGAPATDVVVVSILNHDLSQRVVYAAVETGAGTAQFVRRTCTPTGAADSESVLVEQVALPIADSIRPTPATLPSRPGDDNARVDLAVTPTRGVEITVTGSRRTGSDA